MNPFVVRAVSRRTSLATLITSELAACEGIPNCLEKQERCCPLVADCDLLAYLTCE